MTVQLKLYSSLTNDNESKTPCLMLKIKLGERIKSGDEKY